MNPFLIIIIFALALVAWLLLAPVFNILGAVIKDLVRQAQNAFADKDLDDMNQED